MINDIQLNEKLSEKYVSSYVNIHLIFFLPKSGKNYEIFKDF